MINHTGSDWRSCRSPFAVPLAAIVPLGAFLYCLYFFPHFPFGQYDSATYVGLGDARPFGYALLLSALFALPGKTALLVPVQFALHFGAIVALAMSLRGLTRYTLTLLVLTAALALDGHDLLYDINMLTDSVFYSLVIFALGLTALTLTSQRMVWPALLGFVLGAAVWFRAASLGLMLLPAAVVVLLALQRTRRALVQGLLLVSVLVSTVTAHMVTRWLAVNSFSHSETTALSPFATNAVFIMPPDLRTDHPELYAQVWQSVQWAQDKFRSAATGMERVTIIVNNGRTAFDRVTAEVIDPYIKAHPDEFAADITAVGRGTAALRVVKHFSDATMRADPVGFFRIGLDKFLFSARSGSLYPMQDFVFSEFLSLYQVTTAPLAKFLVPYDPEALRRYQEMANAPFFTEQRFPTAFRISAMIYHHGVVGQQLRLFILVFPLMATVFSVGVAVLAVVRGRNIPPAAALIVVAVPSALVYDFLVNAVEMPLTRYFFPMKPLLLVPALLGLETMVAWSAPFRPTVAAAFVRLMPSRTIIRTWAFNGIALALGCAVALGLGEGLFRLYNPLSDRLHGNEINFDKNLTRVIENNISDKLDKVIHRTSNSIGFRGPEPPAFFDRHLTIIAIGGSTTECYYLTDGKTWPEQLGLRLKTPFPLSWVSNAGMDGHSTFGHFVMVRDYISKIQPKVALFLVGINDVELDKSNPYDGAFDNAVKAAAAGSPRPTLRSVSNHPGTLVVWAAEYSRLASAALNLRRALRSMKAGLGHAPQSWLSQPPPDPRPAAEKAAALEYNRTHFIPLYEERLTSLIRLTKDAGILPVLITQPSLYGRFVDPTTGFDFGPASAWFGDRLELYNDVTRRLSKNYGAPVIDLASRMPKDTALFYDSFHYTNAGAAKVADIVSEELAPILETAFPAFTK